VSALHETVPAALDGERLDRFVALVTGCSRAAAAELVTSGAVRVGRAVVTSGKHKLADGDEVDLDALPASASSVEGDAGVEVVVVHEDDDVLVVDKPAGLVVHPGAGNPTGTLVHGLVAHFPEIAAVGEPDRPGIVHRLDRDTSGLLVVARTEQARARLVRALAAREVEREYLALVGGMPGADAGLVDAPVGRSSREPTRMAVSATGKEARTRYAVESRWPAHDVSLLRCRLETGRTHQIRVHLAAIGHPVVGDETYATGRRPSVSSPRLFLHATRLAFDHPVTGARVEASSPLPADLRAVVDALGDPGSTSDRV
jgi:23S rRNA pseudouridine1911/1915/1917 synthase